MSSPKDGGDSCGKESASQEEYVACSRMANVFRKPFYEETPPDSQESNQVNSQGSDTCNSTTRDNKDEAKDKTKK